MIRKFGPAIIITTVVIALSAIAYAWGAWGHKHINRAAVFALPDQMRVFYYNHIDFVTEAAVVPDLRRPLLQDKQEPPRHFIDVEDYKMPLSDLPKTSKGAAVEFDKSLMTKGGILPWYIQDLMEKLTTAFKKKNKSEILFLSAEIGHYVADAHVPLHTTNNYNGQMTGQKGIHSLWESLLPPMFGDHFNFKTAKPAYIQNIPDYTFKMIAQSHALVEPLLKADMDVRKEFDSTTMYKRDASGKRVMFYNDPVFSDAYAAALQRQLGDMVEQQIRLSIFDISSYWYTAWVNAGSPNLTSLDDPHLTAQNKRNYKTELKAWQKGKLLNLSLGRVMD